MRRVSGWRSYRIGGKLYREVPYVFWCPYCSYQICQFVFGHARYNINPPCPGCTYAYAAWWFEKIEDECQKLGMFTKPEPVIYREHTGEEILDALISNRKYIK